MPRRQSKAVADRRRDLRTPEVGGLGKAEPRTGRYRVPDVLVVVIAVAAAGMLLWAPEFGDQATFRLGVARMLDGAVLYRDFWDIKPPGIFAWYFLGALLGIGDLGIRVLEAVALLTGIPLMRYVAGELGVSSTTRTVSPLFLIVPYVAGVNAFGVGQVEGIVNVALLAAYAAGLRARRGQLPLRWFTAGLLGGIVLVFKPIYLPIVAIVLAGTLVHRHVGVANPRGPSGSRRMSTPWVVGILLAGLALPAVVVVVWCVALGVGPLLYVTVLVLPTQLTALPTYYSSAGFLNVLKSVLKFAALTAVVALPALRSLRRPNLRMAASRELLVLAWLLAAVAVTLVQNPTEYRVLLFAAPLALLATAGLDWWLTVLSAARWRIAAALLVAALLLAPLVAFPSQLLLGIWQVRFALSEDARHHVAVAVSDQQRKIDRIVASRPDEPLGTSTFLFTDPSVYRALNINQPIEMTGWNPDQMTPLMWAEMARELMRSRPRLMYFESTFVPYLRSAGAEVQAVVDRLYEPVPGGTHSDGAWWSTSDPGPPIPSPEGNQLADLVQRRDE